MVSYKTKEQIENIKKKGLCFCCGKKHIVTGGCFVKKVFVYQEIGKKKRYILVRSAFLPCFVKHNKKLIKKLLEDSEGYY